MPDQKDSRQLLVDILSESAVGSTTCEHVRKLCGGIEKGTQHSNLGIGQLAKLSKAHFEEQLHAWAGKQVWRHLLPRIYSFPITFLTQDGMGTEEQLQYFILPHELFNTAHSAGLDLFEHIFGTQKDLKSWWQGAESTPNDWYNKHPIIQEVPSNLRYPLGMHGDDGGMHGQEPVLVLSWNSVVPLKPNDWSRLLFTMVKVSSVSTNTMHAIYSILRWSFTALAEGKFPSADHSGRAFSRQYDPQRFFLAGKPLAGGIRGIWSELRGDWKYLKECLHLQKHAGTRPKICHLCSAGKVHDDMTYSNFASDAGHRATVTDNDDFMARYLAVAMFCPLLLIPGFHIFRVFFDLMHTLDLGVFQLVMPSCLWELTAKDYVWKESTRGKRFAKAYGEYRTWCKGQKVKSITKKRFTFARFRPTAKCYPMMSQVTAKAAATRSMAYWIEELCGKYAESHHEKIRACMMHNFIKADMVCRRAGRYFTTDEHDAFKKHIEKSLRCYNELASEALAAKVLNWKIIPKFHALIHIANDFGNINPRRVHCYADEDMVGKMKRIFTKCHANTACLRSLQRYAMLVALKWWIKLHSLRNIPTD